MQQFSQTSQEFMWYWKDADTQKLFENHLQEDATNTVINSSKIYLFVWNVRNSNITFIYLNLPIQNTKTIITSDHIIRHDFERLKRTDMLIKAESISINDVKSNYINFLYHHIPELSIKID